MTQFDPQQMFDRLMLGIRESLPDLSEEQLQRLDSQLQAVVNTQGPDDAAKDREVTILLSDIRGFTALSERYQATEIVGMLNHYFTRMNEVIHRYGGLIDKYMGDSIMVLFGAHEVRPDDALRAVACAVDMQIEMDQVNRDNTSHGLPELFMGIGINSGHVSAGQLGSELHREYTVIGDEVNLASRIESHSLRGQVLVSENTYARIYDTVEVGERSQVHVKGKSQAVGLYEIIACDWDGRLEVPRREIRTSPRVEVQLPFHYYRLSGKQVLEKQHEAQMVDLSYHGLFALSEQSIDLMTNIKMAVSLSLLGGEMRDIYAKVTSVRKLEQGYGWGIEFTGLDDQSQQALKDYVDRILQSR